MDLIKIVKMMRKNFHEFCEIKHYKFNINDQLFVVDYKLDNQILKIDKKK